MLNFVFASLFALSSLQSPSVVEPPALDVQDLLSEYNAGIELAAVRIESLWVEQIIIDPQEDGTRRRARAVLSYSAGEGMKREVTDPGVPYLVGRYTLRSLLGPLIEPAEYEIEYRGTEEQEGVACHRLSLRALVHDADHFDGDLWISCDAPGPVRIIGKVADPPFPAVEVELDKAFERGPSGIWLVRRHTGRVEVRLLASRTGTRHIFYEDYLVRVRESQSTGAQAVEKYREGSSFSH